MTESFPPREEQSPLDDESDDEWGHWTASGIKTERANARQTDTPGPNIVKIEDPNVGNEWCDGDSRSASTAPESGSWGDARSDCWGASWYESWGKSWGECWPESWAESKSESWGTRWGDKGDVSAGDTRNEWDSDSWNEPWAADASSEEKALDELHAEVDASYINGGGLEAQRAREKDCGNRSDEKFVSHV